MLARSSQLGGDTSGTPSWLRFRSDFIKSGALLSQLHLSRSQVDLSKDSATQVFVRFAFGENRRERKKRLLSFLYPFHFRLETQSIWSSQLGTRNQCVSGIEAKMAGQKTHW